MTRKGCRRDSELVQCLVELGSKRLVDQLKAGEDQARLAMREIAHDLCCRYGGQLLYIPQDRGFALMRRDLDLAAEHTGKNVAELAAKYKISTVQVRAILAHVRRSKTAGEALSNPPGA